MYSAASFGAKVGLGLGVGLVGWVLALGAYEAGAASQPESAILAMKALNLYLPTALYGVLALLLWAYRLDEQFPAIMAELRARRQG